MNTQSVTADVNVNIEKDNDKEGTHLPQTIEHMAALVEDMGACW